MVKSRTAIFVTIQSCITIFCTNWSYYRSSYYEKYDTQTLRHQYNLWTTVLLELVILSGNLILFHESISSIFCYNRRHGMKISLTAPAFTFWATLYIYGTRTNDVLRQHAIDEHVCFLFLFNEFSSSLLNDTLQVIGVLLQFVQHAVHYVELSAIPTPDVRLICSPVCYQRPANGMPRLYFGRTYVVMLYV